jgi:hypothetical protein
MSDAFEGSPKKRKRVNRLWKNLNKKKTAAKVASFPK